MNTLALIDEITALPVEDRAFVAQSLLLSLNQPEINEDSKWGNVAAKRLESLRSGEVEAVDGEKVFKNICQRFDK